MYASPKPDESHISRHFMPYLSRDRKDTTQSTKLFPESPLEAETLSQSDYVSSQPLAHHVYNIETISIPVSDYPAIV